MIPAIHLNYIVSHFREYKRNLIIYELGSIAPNSGVEHELQYLFRMSRNLISPLPIYKNKFLRCT